MNSPTHSDEAACQLGRRPLLAAGGIAAVGAAAGLWRSCATSQRAAVFIAKNQSYQGPLEQTVRDGLRACGIEPDHYRGRRVLLKPNLVEPSRDAPHMTTHPALIIAAAEVFRRAGAKVTVGEGPGHVRDTEMALAESGVGEALAAAGLSFADLNYEDTAWVKNAGRRSGLMGFHFPRSAVEADLIVSLPKMKTHHWVGVTCAMKNLYGVIPGIKYGWPKNVLHHNGIPETVYDINASLPKTVAVVDAIDCMEGDGPIMGSLKRMGLILASANLTAVDATACRLMDVLPERVSYLSLADGRLGPIRDHRIEQRGEPWRPLASPFQMLDKPHLQSLRPGPGVLVS
jgi:uncharacterized protein (DUF362 family)